MECIEGYVEKIKFRNTDNGYTVMNVVTEVDDIILVGTFSFISEGEYIKAYGEYTSHPLYGEQLQVSKYEIIEPKDAVAMERYLASGAIKGIKEATARKIISKFGEDTFRIIECEPERLAEIKGISAKKAREIGEQFEEKRDLREAMIFLQKYGISTTYAVKIYKYYGYRMYDIIRENPYKLAEDISGIGFKLADEIATKVGINVDSDFRIRAGIMYVLTLAAGAGNIYLPKNVLKNKVAELLLTDISTLDVQLENLQVERKVVIKEVECEGDPNKKEIIIYNASLYYTELNCARMLMDLNIKYDLTYKNIEKRLQRTMENIDIELDEHQKTAVLEAIRNGITIITGGPGTGKTTTINTIIRMFEQDNLNILLAAPTGRAAKRMSETTKRTAQTIHRLLEISGARDSEEDKFTFERNEENPLEADVIIIDEMSMVDINLMNALLKAIPIGTRLILVGDVNQLPSVGPGNILKDIIKSHSFNVVMLTKIFRQATESDIVTNAHKINAGESIRLDNKSKDFFMLQRNDAMSILGVVVSLVRDKMPKYVNAKSYDIQVLTPMKKGELGVEKLNQVLQNYLNPPKPGKQEKEAHGCIFREKDKVMQIKNNYQIEWEIRSEFNTLVDNGTGVFNGDVGIIKEINNFAEIVKVVFDEGKIVEYKFSQLDELELAYAITIHKSQGSEYPAIVMPIFMGPKMLMNRNLLYTAVTRAKKCVTIVGSSKMVQLMIDNESEQKRYTSLDKRIMELSAS